MAQVPTFNPRDRLVQTAYIEASATIAARQEIPTHYMNLALPKSVRVDRSKLARTPLPKIFGLQHIESSLEKCLRLIDRLPTNSQVGLEGNAKLNYCPGYPAVAQEKLGTSFFDKVAAYAEAHGHKVVWLERSVGALGATWLKSAKAIRGPSRQVRYKPRHSADEITFRTMLWRSCIQSRSVLQRTWKTSDVVIVGGYHGLHLSRFWDRPLHGIFSRNGLTLPEQLVEFTKVLKLGNYRALELDSLRRSPKTLIGLVTALVRRLYFNRVVGKIKKQSFTTQRPTRFAANSPTHSR